MSDRQSVVTPAELTTRLGRAQRKLGALSERVDDARAVRDELIVQLALSGMSYRDIGKSIELSTASIGKIVKAGGVSYRVTRGES